MEILFKYMSSEITKLNSSKKNKVFFNVNTSCLVSQASAELMLHRFCDGKENDFPFNKN